jgi:hypothetical protein
MMLPQPIPGREEVLAPLIATAACRLAQRPPADGHGLGRLKAGTTGNEYRYVLQFQGLGCMIVPTIIPPAEAVICDILWG